MDDLISRQDAIDAFDCKNELIVSGEENARNVMNYIVKVICKIKDLPSVQPRRGKWIPHQSNMVLKVRWSMSVVIVVKMLDSIPTTSVHTAEATTEVNRND